MRDQMKSLWHKYRQTIVYIFFGGLTTLVNWIVYFPLYNWMQLTAATSAGIAWAVSVIFAFITNKPFVFESKDWSSRRLIPEFFRFLFMRIGTGVLEVAVLSCTVDNWQWNGNLMKIVLCVLVVILNYIASKFFVFKK